jgi:hypothetical protein
VRATTTAEDSDERRQRRCSDGRRQLVHSDVTDGEREATASMAADSDSGIDEYASIATTIAENSGHGTVDAVVHRPPRNSEDKPRRQSRYATRCGEGVCASATPVWYMAFSDVAACGVQRRTAAAVGAAGNHGARCCNARNAPAATAAQTQRPRDSRKHCRTHADTWQSAAVSERCEQGSAAH